MAERSLAPVRLQLSQQLGDQGCLPRAVVADQRNDVVVALLKRGPKLLPLGMTVTKDVGNDDRGLMLHPRGGRGGVQVHEAAQDSREQLERRADRWHHPCAGSYNSGPWRLVYCDRCATL